MTIPSHIWFSELYLLFFILHCSNLSGEQTNNAFYNCIDSAPDIPDGKVVPLGLDMVKRERDGFIIK